MARLVVFTHCWDTYRAIEAICGTLGWASAHGADNPEYWVQTPDADAALFDLQHPLDDGDSLSQRFMGLWPLRPLVFLTDDMVTLEELDEGVNYTVDARHLGDLEHILLSLTFGYSSGVSFPVEGGQSNGVPRILIVDDNVQLAAAIEHALRGAQPCDVRVVSSGFEAASMVQNFRPDVAIVDLVLGDMDGREVCSYIRKCEGLQTTKIIGVSGYLPSQTADGQPDHFDIFLEKPFRLKEIIDRVREFTQR